MRMTLPKNYLFQIWHTEEVNTNLILSYDCIYVIRNKLLDLFKWNIGWKWIKVYLDIPFTNNVHGLETSQLFCIANHLTSFCLIRVVTERFFWRESSKFVNVTKSVSDIDLFIYECKLVIFFSPLKCHVQNFTSGTFPFHLM